MHVKHREMISRGGQPEKIGQKLFVTRNKLHGFLIFMSKIMSL